MTWEDGVKQHTTTWLRVELARIAPEYSPEQVGFMKRRVLLPLVLNVLRKQRS